MRRKRGNFRRRIGGNNTAVLRMTSLMDVFTTLLLFLLKSFVADGQSGTVTPGVVLPPSVAQSEPWDAPVIAVTRDYLSCEGNIIPVTAALQGTDLRVEPLHAQLVQLRQAGESRPGFAPRIVVQGDRSIEFRLLQRVIATSHLAGFTQVSLAVVQDGTAVAMAGTAAP